MPDDRELARELLSGQITVAQAAKMRSSSAPATTNGQTAVAAATAAPPIQPGAVPVRKDPTLTNAPSTDRKFPCKACGAKLDFDPSQRALKCPYCGHEEQIAPATAKVQEFDFAAYLQKQSTDPAPIAGRSAEIRCPGCGASVLLEDNVVTDQCPFCATHLDTTASQSAQSQIAPAYLLPFAVTNRQAIDAFNRWISSLWFAPSHLRQLANLGQLSGVYVPFWTYDSMTYTHYTGQRGDDYWETESYTERDANGNMVTRTRQVRRTRWTYVSGEVDHFFDDILVCASKSLPTQYVDKLEPWDLQDLESFNPSFLAGFKTERYVVNLGEGFGVAQQVMDHAIRGLCCRDIGGDHQSLSSVSTQHVGVTFKHILLPIWLAVYRYNNQTYRILVNARTGEVQGTRPYSWLKITALILAILAAILVIVAIIAASQGGHSYSRTYRNAAPSWPVERP